MELQILFLINLSLSAFMCGVIWLVQVLIYPSFRLVRDIKHHQFHMKAISYVVVPVMLLELVSTVFYYFQVRDQLLLLVLVLLILIWLSTFLLQVPQHQKIQLENSDEAINRLISSNWIRTILWSAKTLLLLWYGIA
jgi:L-asparagine transporter-like permease